MVFTARNGNAASGFVGGGLSPETTQPPSGSINKDLIGYWGGMIGNNTEIYIEFRDDGTYSELMAIYTGIEIGAGRFNSSKYRNTSVRVGQWSYSEGTINLTQAKMFSWYGRHFTPTEDAEYITGTIVWKNISDYSMQIETHEPDDHTIERHFMWLGVRGVNVATNYYDFQIGVNTESCVMEYRDELPYEPDYMWLGE